MRGGVNLARRLHLDGGPWRRFRAQAPASVRQPSWRQRFCCSRRRRPGDRRSRRPLHRCWRSETPVSTTARVTWSSDPRDCRDPGGRPRLVLAGPGVQYARLGSSLGPSELETKAPDLRRAPLRSEPVPDQRGQPLPRRVRPLSDLAGERIRRTCFDRGHPRHIPDLGVPGRVQGADLGE